MAFAHKYTMHYLYRPRQYGIQTVPNVEASQTFDINASFRAKYQQLIRPIPTLVVHADGIGERFGDHNSRER